MRLHAHDSTPEALSASFIPLWAVADVHTFLWDQVLSDEDMHRRSAWRRVREEFERSVLEPERDIPGFDWAPAFQAFLSRLREAEVEITGRARFSTDIVDALAFICEKRRATARDGGESRRSHSPCSDSRDCA